MLIDDELYRKILQVVPIPCVDLVISDPSGAILLLKRTNEPARGHWWFPGGRVHHGETRFDAARRKLREECGLEATRLVESGTFDVILDLPGGVASHAISTVFRASVQDRKIRLDSQSQEARWETPAQWAKEPLSPFVKSTLEAVR